MEALAASILAIAPPEFALLGLSMGGIVAMEMIRQAPERVTRLALLDTNALADPPENAAMREAQVKRALDGELRSVMRDEMKPNYLADGTRRDAILGLCMEMAEALGPNVFAAQSAAVQHRPDQRETLKTADVPTLLMCGEEDRLCPPARHELMHDLIPGSKLTLVPNAGHLITLEQPDQTNEALKEWLKQ